MKVLFFGDGPWATTSLQLLIDAGFEIVGVILRTRPSSPCLGELGTRLGLPVLTPPQVNAPEFIARVRELGPDINLSVSYDQIFRAEVRQSAPLGLINVHAGKLPYYRGRNVLNWAIMNNEREIGVTSHYVDDGIDTGDILLQRTLPIEWEDDYRALLLKVTTAFPEHVLATMIGLREGSLTPTPQAHLPGTYFAMRRNGDEYLDWHDTSLQLYNKVRAIAPPAPGARTFLDGRELVILRATYDPAWPAYQETPGQVVGRQPGRGVLVKTGDSTLLVTEAAWVGEEPFTPRWPIGTRLGINLLLEHVKLTQRVAELEQALAQYRNPERGATDGQP